MKNFLSVLFALVAGLGWNWTGFLAQAEWITNSERLTVSIILTGLFIIQQIYLVLPKPVSKIRAQRRAEVVEAYLEGLQEKYIALFSPGTPPAIRINVMLIIKHTFFFEKIKIFYTCCPPRLLYYTDEEKEMRWGKGEGTSGWAWKTVNTVAYDSVNGRLNSAAKRLSPQQEMLTKPLLSVLSVPIINDNMVVGVLNLDCEFDITLSGFDSKNVQELARNYVHRLSTQCFEEGVEA